MPDSEKVIGHLNDCMEASRRDNTWVFVRKDIVEDAISLLKEQEDLGTELTNAVELLHKKNERIEKLLKKQEAVEPYRVNTHCDQHWKCSHCDSVIGVQDKYCRQCGHALKWKMTI